MPLITAGLGLITGVALIGLGTHVTNMSNISPELALMIGLGVGIDYALFIVTRFRENYLEYGDVERSIVEAMDTSGRAILLAGATVVIALLGMFATGVAFMYGLAIAAVLAVLAVLAGVADAAAGAARRASARGIVRRPPDRRTPSQRRRCTSSAAALSVAAVERDRAGAAVAAGDRVAGGDGRAAGAGVRDAARLQRRRQRSVEHQLTPGVRPAREGLRRRASTARCCSSPSSQHGNQAARWRRCAPRSAPTPGVVAVTAPRIAPSGNVAVLQAYPNSAPQAVATTNLVNHLRDTVLPALERQTGMTVLVGGFTAGSIDFSHVLASKLPLFFGWS